MEVKQLGPGRFMHPSSVWGGSRAETLQSYSSIDAFCSTRLLVSVVLPV
jgi:hypothetical protein